MIELLARFLCRWLHGDAVCWPHHGHYECRKCQRRYAVRWSPADMRIQQPSPQVPLGEEVRTEWESLSVNSRI